MKKFSVLVTGFALSLSTFIHAADLAAVQKILESGYEVSTDLSVYEYDSKAEVSLAFEKLQGGADRSEKLPTRKFTTGDFYSTASNGEVGLSQSRELPFNSHDGKILYKDHEFRPRLRVEIQTRKSGRVEYTLSVSANGMPLSKLLLGVEGSIGELKSMRVQGKPVFLAEAHEIVVPFYTIQPVSKESVKIDEE